MIKIDLVLLLSLRVVINRIILLILLILLIFLKLVMNILKQFHKGFI